MISLLVSSKTMQSNNSPFEVELSEPQHLIEAAELKEILKQKSPKSLQKLMHISPKLAEATRQNIVNWRPDGGTPAWYTFIGDVYKGLKISEFTKSDVKFAQSHMGTISGLYGLVRPLDTVFPYRLELMYKFKGRVNGNNFKNLYEFWGKKIADIIPANEAVINLASEEYIKVLRPYLAKSHIITPWFLQTKKGKPDFQVVHAKMARGMMARWIAINRINDPVLLKNFNYGGYIFNSVLSDPLKPTFIRPEGYDFRADY